MKVPILDLKLQFSSIRQELLTVLEQVCDEQGFVLGSRVESLEESLAKFCGTSQAVGVALRQLLVKVDLVLDTLPEHIHQEVR